MRFNILILTLFCFLSFALNGNAEIFNELNLRNNSSYILSLPEEVIRIESGNEKALKIEKNIKIFNNDHELVISVKSPEKTNFLVWTKNNLYVYKVIFDNKKKESDLLVKIDVPPLIPIKMEGGQLIDEPPVLKVK